jgi:hypothetical protein
MSLWNDATTGQLLALAGTMPTSAIARQLSQLTGLAFSKNAVLGKLSRIAAREAKARHVRTGPTPRDWPRGMFRPPKRAIFIDPLGHEQSIGDWPLRTIVELDEATCRWPIRETAATGRHLFCAAPAVSGQPYCDVHLARAFRSADEGATHNGDGYSATVHCE